MADEAKYEAAWEAQVRDAALIEVRQERDRLRKALDMLLASPPTFRDYTGTDETTCGYCHAPLEGFESGEPNKHAATCPWDRARRALGGSNG